MKEITLIFPIPDAKLSPNARVHWAAKSKIVKAHRQRASQGTPDFLKNKKVLAYQLDFIFPNNIRRDIDNFTARCKSYLDGISDAIEQDDSTWDMKAPTRAVKKGMSVVRITLFIED